MAKGVGRLVQFGIAKETTRGTPNAGADFWIPFSELDFQEKFENALDEESRGVIEDSVGQTRYKNWAEGTIKCPVEDKSFPLVLYATFGTLASTTNADGSGSVRNHTITVGQTSQHQALSLFIDDPLGGQDYKHGNGAVNTLEINYEQKKFINFSLSVMALKGATATLTPASSSLNRFLPQHLVFKTASTYGTLSTGSVIVLKSLQLTISNSIESDDVLGNVAPVDFLNKQFSIEGNLEALWQNESDFKTNTLAGTVKALRLSLINTDVTIGSAANPTIQIDLAKCVFTEISRPVKLNDLIMQAVKFKAHYSSTDSLMASILCTNLQGSY
jgi:hypothetical protein